MLRIARGRDGGRSGEQRHVEKNLTVATCDCVMYDARRGLLVKNAVADGSTVRRDNEPYRKFGSDNARDARWESIVSEGYRLRLCFFCVEVKRVQLLMVPYSVHHRLGTRRSDTGPAFRDNVSGTIIRRVHRREQSQANARESHVARKDVVLVGVADVAWRPVVRQLSRTGDAEMV